mmetsp:Transcript_21027/g.68045  ORF Transcript_21027/g.68045 Transcript_21027/m.68045 type:complete len:280 (+) Transcript_21027:798-1637(+)
MAERTSGAPSQRASAPPRSSPSTRTNPRSSTASFCGCRWRASQRKGSSRSRRGKRCPSKSRAKLQSRSLRICASRKTILRSSVRTLPRCAWARMFGSSWCTCARRARRNGRPSLCPTVGGSRSCGSRSSSPSPTVARASTPPTSSRSCTRSGPTPAKRAKWSGSCSMAPASPPRSSSTSTCSTRSTSKARARRRSPCSSRWRPCSRRSDRGSNTRRIWRCGSARRCGSPPCTATSLPSASRSGAKTTSLSSKTSKRSSPDSWIPVRNRESRFKYNICVS